MAKNYARNLPQDRFLQTMQNFPPAVKALKQYHKENASTSSVITLTHDTTIVEITAAGVAAGFRWVATSDTAGSVITAAGTTANFDHIVPAATTRQFVVPIEKQGNSLASVQGVNRGEGLYQRVAFISAGIGSVLLSEF